MDSIRSDFRVCTNATSLGEVLSPPLTHLSSTSSVTPELPFKEQVLSSYNSIRWNGSENTASFFPPLASNRDCQVMLSGPTDETFSSIQLHGSTAMPSTSMEGSTLLDSLANTLPQSPELDAQLMNYNKPEGPKEGTRTVYDYQVLDSNQELYDLAQHKGQVLLICNIATRCKEYAEKAFTILSTLQRLYHDQGFTVLAFPCKQFGTSELGGEEEVAQTVSSLYPGVGDITFPILSRVDVNGSYESPLYTYLKSCLKGTVGQTSIKWNFTYFLINREGVPVARLPPETEMEELKVKVKKVLCTSSPQDG